MALERPDQIASDFLARISGSPDVYLQKLQIIREAAFVIPFDAGMYRAASFLDDRILGPKTRGLLLSLWEVVRRSRASPSVRPLRFIFHSGHVGSTLVSRLLDEAGSVLSLREPLPLRQLAEAHDGIGRTSSLLSPGQFDELLDCMLHHWARGYPSTGMTVVKATSATGRLAPAIFTRRPDARGIYMNLRAEPYLAILLSGQSSNNDLRGHGAERIERLERLGVSDLAPLHVMSLGEMAAMGWLAETWSQRLALDGFGERMIGVDFDAFLADVPGEMKRIAVHFGLPGDAPFLADIGRNPALTRYSKAPEHGYSPELRAEILTQSRTQNRDEIRKGLAWLERTGKACAAAGEVIAKAGSGL
jgi:hypothetical protein